MIFQLLDISENKKTLSAGVQAAKNAGVNIRCPKDVLITTAPDVDVTTKHASTPVTQGVEIVTGTAAKQPLKLLCPDENPDQFLSTSWYLLAKDLMIRLYRITEQGVVYKYEDSYILPPGMNVTHDITNTSAIMIYGDTCNHTVTYQCMRWARVGYVNQVYNFSVINCTVSKEVDLASQNTDAAVVNISPPRMASSLIFIIELTAMFTLIY